MPERSCHEGRWSTNGKFVELRPPKVRVELGHHLNIGARALDARSGPILFASAGFLVLDLFMFKFILIGALWLGMIPTVLAVEPVPTATPAELVKLEWMVGSWVHESEGAVVKMSGNWSENRQFLQRVFELKLGNAPGLVVHQILYWDPISKALRSWGYSSDGSFESGKWTVEGKSVHNERVITYPDGESGTAVNTWELADPKKCILTSAKRKLRGQSKPDIAPTELERM